MINFEYARATDVDDAVRQIASDPGAKFIAGGTNLIDLMKENVERPPRLIDISRLPLNKVEETADGGVQIGALVPNSDVAYHPLIEHALSNAQPAPSSPAPRSNYAIWLRPAAISCNGPAATISTTPRRPATNASQEADARP